MGTGPNLNSAAAATGRLRLIRRGTRTSSLTLGRISATVKPLPGGPQAEGRQPEGPQGRVRREHRANRGSKVGVQKQCDSGSGSLATKVEAGAAQDEVR